MGYKEILMEQELKSCGFFGCHVRNDGECECTKCSMTTGGCDDCTKFPNRARTSIWFMDAMQEKCNACRDIDGVND